MPRIAYAIVLFTYATQFRNQNAMLYAIAIENIAMERHDFRALIAFCNKPCS